MGHEVDVAVTHQSMPSRLSRLGFINTGRTNEPVRQRIRSRGAPSALIDHEVFASVDPYEANQLLGRLLGPGRLSLEHPSSDFRASLHAVRLRDVTYAHLDLSVPVKVSIARTGDFFTVHMPTRGTQRCVYDGSVVEIAPYQALVVNPGSSLEMRLELDSPQQIIRIERPAIERQLSRMLGRSLDSPIRFSPVLDLTTDEAARWHGAIHVLSTEVMTTHSLVQQGVGVGPIEELIMSSLLLIQPSSHRSSLVRAGAPRSRAAVRLAVDFIEQNLSRPISLSAIAEHTGMSTRSIQVGFREDLDTTPVAYIRDRRLERVRDELTDALPIDGITVTEVAARWGFSHLGNFAIAYRRRFDESPSETLRR